MNIFGQKPQVIINGNDTIAAADADQLALRDRYLLGAAQCEARNKDIVALIKELEAEKATNDKSIKRGFMVSNNIEVSLGITNEETSSKKKESSK